MKRSPIRLAADTPVTLPRLAAGRFRRDSTGRTYVIYPDGSYRRLNPKRADPAAMPTARGRRREARVAVRGYHYFGTA